MNNNHSSIPLQRITSRIKDVGGIPVSRAIPVKERRLIGAWCFLDHAGPSVLKQDNGGFRVASHPHTCLQTFTWMLEGEVLHRDSLGYEQIIRPGQVNLMTAGHGIAHTEESVPGFPRLHAAQLWIALPAAVKDMPPRFDHYPTLPVWDADGIRHTLLAGDYASYHAPTLCFSDLLGVDLYTPDGSNTQLTLQPDFEYGLFVLEGEINIEGERFAENELAYIGTQNTLLNVTLAPKTRVLFLGGEPLGEQVLMWWNFVGRSKEELRQSIADWNQDTDRFGTVHGFKGERTPSPEMP